MSVKVFDQLLKNYVDSPEFFNSMVEQIEMIDKPDLKFKLMLELVELARPKFKPVDSEHGRSTPSIEIVYEDVDENTTSETPESLPNE